MKNKLGKIFGISLLSVSFLACAAGAIVSNNVKEEPVAVKAEEEYTVYNTNITNAYIHYNCWIVLSFDNFSGKSSNEACNFNFKDFNTVSNIYLNGDEEQQAITASYANFGVYNSDKDIYLQPVGGKFDDGAAITIPAGTEFPSYGTVKGTEKVKYVTQSDTTFYYIKRNGAKDELTPESMINFIDSDVIDFSNEKPNPTWPGFKLSVNDFADGTGTLSNSSVFKFLSLYNRVTNTAEDGKVYKVFGSSVGTALTNYSGCTDYFSINNANSAWGRNFLNYRLVFIPKGSLFPSYQFAGNISTVNTVKSNIYRTTKDVIYYCSSQWGNKFTKVEPTFVDNEIASIGGTTSFPQGEPSKQYTNFVLDAKVNNKAKAGSNKAACMSLANLISNIEFYKDNTLLKLTNVETVSSVDYDVLSINYGAQFCDFGGHDMLSQIITDGMDTANKVIIKKGAIFPSYGAICGENAVWYKIAKDQQFINFGGQWGSCNTIEGFINDYMHPEVPTTDAGTGKCITEGWYAAAKPVFNSLGYSNIVVLANTAQYKPYWTRLNAWAAANGESFDAINSVMKTTPISTINVVEGNNTALIVIIAISVCTIAALSFVTIYRRKKHE